MKRLLLLAVLVGAVWMWWGRTPGLVDTSSPSAPGKRSAPTPPRPRSLEDKKRPPLAQVMPSLDTIRDEVAADPHVTPRSILLFAEALAPRLERAFASESDADRFLDELRECAKTPGDDVVRGLCVKSALRLTAVYPSLASRGEAIESEVTPEIRALAR